MIDLRAGWLVGDIKSPRIINLHVEALSLTLMHHINLEQLQSHAVHGKEFKMSIAQFDIKIGDHAAKISRTALIAIVCESNSSS
jgi:hypothetical protein